jgi:oxaloacetate decarboxylase beta subunit
MREFIAEFLQTRIPQYKRRPVIMLVISCVLLYLGIYRKYEPLLLIPIAFGMLLANIPISGITDGPVGDQPGGLIYYLYQGVKWGIYPPLIFLGIGAMTDFAPLIANPASLLLGAAAQIGIFVPFIIATFIGFRPQAAASIGIIGGADARRPSYLTSRLKPDCWGPSPSPLFLHGASADYPASHQCARSPPPRNERSKWLQLRKITKTERIVFPIGVTIFVDYCFRRPSPWWAPDARKPFQGIGSDSNAFPNGPTRAHQYLTISWAFR